MECILFHVNFMFFYPPQGSSSKHILYLWCSGGGHYLLMWTCHSHYLPWGTTLLASSVESVNHHLHSGIHIRLGLGNHQVPAKFKTTFCRSIISSYYCLCICPGNVHNNAWSTNVHFRVLVSWNTLVDQGCQPCPWYKHTSLPSVYHYQWGSWCWSKIFRFPDDFCISNVRIYLHSICHTCHPANVCIRNNVWFPSIWNGVKKGITCIALPRLTKLMAIFCWLVLIVIFELYVSFFLSDMFHQSSFRHLMTIWRNTSIRHSEKNVEKLQIDRFQIFLVV